MFTYRICPHCTTTTMHGKYCDHCGRKLSIKHLRLSTRLAVLILTVVALGLGFGVALAATGTLQEPTHLSLSAATTTHECTGAYTYTATLQNANNQGVAGEPITITRNGALVETLTTDTNGRVSATHEITNCDENNLEARYDGSIIYTQAQATTLLTAKKPVNIAFTIPQTTVGTQTTAVLRVTDETDDTPVAHAVIRVGASAGERYVLTDNLGTATLPLTFSASGEYVLKAEYAGDEEYAPASASTLAHVTHPTLAQQTQALQSSIAYIESPAGSGAGVVLVHTKNKTIILTNRHVIDAQPLTVTLDGEHMPARVRNAPQNIDLAVVELDGLYGTPVQTESHAERGESVYALGSPHGLQGSISAGIISNIYATGNVTILQTDTAINPGNSGGGLFNTNGALVGITTAKLRDTEGIGFAIGIDTLKRLPNYTEWN